MRKALVVLLVAAGAVGIVGWEGAFGQVEGPRVLSEKEMVDVRFGCCMAHSELTGDDTCFMHFPNPCSLSLSEAECGHPYTACNKVLNPGMAWSNAGYSADPNSGTAHIANAYCTVRRNGSCTWISDTGLCECTGYGDWEVMGPFCDYESCDP